MKQRRLMTPLQRLQSFVASNTGDNQNTMIEMSYEDARELLREIDVMVCSEKPIASRSPSEDLVTQYLIESNRSSARQRMADLDAWIQKQYHEGRLA